MKKQELLNEQIKIVAEVKKLHKEIDELHLEQKKLNDCLKQKNQNIKNIEKNIWYGRLWMFIYSALAITCFFGLLLTSTLVPSFGLGTTGSLCLVAYNFREIFKYFDALQKIKDEGNKIIKKIEEYGLVIDNKLEEINQLEDQKMKNHKLLNEIAKSERIAHVSIMQKGRDKQKVVCDGSSKNNNLIK